MSESDLELEKLRIALGAAEGRAAAAETDLAQARAVVSTSEAMVAALKLETALLKRKKCGTHRAASRPAGIADLGIGDRGSGRRRALLFPTRFHHASSARLS